MENKIVKYVDALIDSYSESVQITDGLTFDMKDTIRTVEFYSNSKYISGNMDELGKEKPFYNVGNFRVTVAKVATDLDVKDLRFEADSLKFSTQTMLINRELFEFLKEMNYSKSLNEQGYIRAKYGGVLVKKYKGDDGIEIEPVEWKNVNVDPSNILDNPIVETHYLSPGDFSVMEWENTTEVLQASAKFNKNKPAKIEIKEITGGFPETFEPDNEGGSEYKYKTFCFYLAYVGNKKFYLHYEVLKDIEEKYKYLAWEKVSGRALGRGVWEDGFESQTWTNDSMISMKNAMELSGKVILSTTSKKISGNAITSIKSGHIFELEDGKTISSLNLAPSALPQLENIINLWDTQYNKASSTYDANTGEAPTAGTPYSQTALLNQVANSPFEYRREEMGIFQEEILNEWILPEVKKRIIKNHNLVSEYSDDELDTIDESVANFEGKNLAIEALLSGTPLTPGQDIANKDAVRKGLSKFGNKREVVIPKGYLDVEGKITANITGELKNKGTILQSLDNILKTVVATFNPNTGTYAALEDPTLKKIFGYIVEQAGIPLSFSQLGSKKGQGSAAPQPAPSTPNLSAVQPIKA